MSYHQMMWESPQALLRQPDFVDVTSPCDSFPHHPAQKIQKLKYALQKKERWTDGDRWKERKGGRKEERKGGKKEGRWADEKKERERKVGGREGANR